MAKARIICGECGAGLLAGIEYCSKCGAKVELPDEGTAEASGSPGHHDQPHKVCEVCGNGNDPAANFCEACGAHLLARVPDHLALSDRKTHASHGPSVRQVAKVKRAGGKSARAKRSRIFNSSTLVGGTLVAALIGFFAYTEVTRVTSPEHVHNQADGAQASSASALIHEIEHAQESVRDNPNDPASLLRLANLLHDAGQFDKRLFSRAVENYERYLALRPSDPNARVDLGICYFELSRIDTAKAQQLITRAISEMEMTVQSHPKHQAASFNLGIVNLYSGRIEESNKWFQRAADLDPESDLGKRAKRIIEQHTLPSPPI